jgi:hypothetical protein
MNFWIREFAGWLLVMLGLFVFYRCYFLLTSNTYIQGGILAAIGFVLFRGGIHLLKVAVAARICIETEDRMIALKPDSTRLKPRQVQRGSELVK